MKILVLVKEVPDTYGERRLDLETGYLDRESGEQVVDEIDERALEVALQIKDSDKSTEVVVATLGPESAKDALRKCLSMGADSAVHVLDDALAGSDTLRTAQALAAVARRVGFDAIIAGNESTDGRGGVVPAMVAELLGLPLVGNLSSVDLTATSVRGVQATAAATATLSSSLPAVITITEKSAEARFPNFKGIMTAKRKPLEALTRADLGLEESAAASEVLSVAERPSRAAGSVITDEGDAGAKIVAFLRERKAI